MWHFIASCLQPASLSNHLLVVVAFFVFGCCLRVITNITVIRTVIIVVVVFFSAAVRLVSVASVLLFALRLGSAPGQLDVIMVSFLMVVKVMTQVYTDDGEIGR